jgi:EAL domain-containing protein (putative c-di-GMP-specific phosphodiesterase class I)
MALYRAKQSGKNTYYPYTPNLMETALKRFNLETKLRSAIKENSFQIYYQPKLDLMETEIIGVEALIRWPQENGSFVSPADFIPLAESTGLIHPIGEWVMRTACSEVLKWIKAGRSLSLAVNLSAKQFFSEQIIEDIKRILSETEFPPNLLNLEITENAAVSNTELTIEIMRELTEMGISFSLDDFGTGYSSLSYLKKFPLSVIKVDKSFVTGIPNDQDDVSITKAVISMGKSLNLTVVAEGVETEEQRSFLTIQGCDEIQGYLIGKPMDRADFTDFILDKN